MLNALFGVMVVVAAFNLIPFLFNYFYIRFKGFSTNSLKHYLYNYAGASFL